MPLLVGKYIPSRVYHQARPSNLCSRLFVSDVLLFLVRNLFCFSGPFVGGTVPHLQGYQNEAPPKG